jgi:hypothetical protein
MTPNLKNARANLQLLRQKGPAGQERHGDARNVVHHLLTSLPDTALDWTPVKAPKGFDWFLGPSLCVKSWSILASITDQSRSLPPTGSQLPTLAYTLFIQVCWNIIGLP